LLTSGEGERLGIGDCIYLEVAELSD
jgi:hypothetical protein